MGSELLNAFAALLLMALIGGGLARWFRWRRALYRRIVHPDAGSDSRVRQTRGPRRAALCRRIAF
jgi:hypothetical protein